MQILNNGTHLNQQKTSKGIFSWHNLVYLDNSYCLIIPKAISNLYNLDPKNQSNWLIHKNSEMFWNESSHAYRN